MDRNDRHHHFSASGWVRFARYQKHVSTFKGIVMAFSEYQDKHRVMPIENHDDLWRGGWRTHLLV